MSKRASDRKGATLPETAVCLPLLALFVFSMIQFISMVYLRHKMTSAAYIGMQQLAQVGSTEDEILRNVRAILLARGVVNSTVEILPARVLDTAPKGTEFSIRISAPTARNMAGPLMLPVGGTMTVTQYIYR